MKTTPAIITLDALDQENFAKCQWHTDGGIEITIPVNDDTVLRLRLSDLQADRLAKQIDIMIHDAFVGER